VIRLTLAGLLAWMLLHNATLTQSAGARFAPGEALRRKDVTLQDVILDWQAPVKNAAPTPSAAN